MKIIRKLYDWRKEHKKYYVLKLKYISKKKKEDMEEWLEENCSAEWSIYYAHSFSRSYCACSDEIDAMAFKLMWS